MPDLQWKGKHQPPVEPIELSPDSILYPGGKGHPGARPDGRLILGENLRVMASLLPRYEGRIHLIYADPPFFTNRSYKTRIGRGEDSRKPSAWKLAAGYRDAWPDLDSYLQFLYERLVLMHRLLSPQGSLYLHLDWHADAYARLILDEVFGPDRLLNEIIWAYHGPSPIRSAFNRKHDTILAYTKGPAYTFNADAVREPYHPNTVTTFKSSPRAGFGKVPDLARGKVPEDWWYFPVVARLHHERTGYPTQKPEALLKRILLASSNPGDLVADFFCGSGTAAVSAARLGRKFIACDSSFRAVQTVRSRLAGSPAVVAVDRAVDHPIPALKGSPDVSITASAGVVRLNTRLDLDFWEVDPDWDGEVFRSAAQAVRPTRQDAPPRELEIKTGRRVCVRFVTVSGKQGQSHI